MHLSSRWLAAALLTAACGSRSEPPRGGTAPAPLPVVDAGVAPVVAPAVPAAPASTAPTHLTVLFEGPCAKPRVGHLGAQPAFVFEQNVAYFDGNEPRELRREKEVRVVNAGTSMAAHSFLGEVGGLDPAHAWVLRYEPSRGEGYDGDVLFAAKGFAGAAYGQGERRRSYHASGPIEQPDGSLWAFAEEGFYNEGPSTSHFVAWSPRGDLLDVHLPGRDMRDSQRLASGELVSGARSKKRQVVLRRWSPEKPVDDLVVHDSPAGDSAVQLRVGSRRAVLVTEAHNGSLAFYTYDGASLQAVALPVAVAPSDSWLLTTADDLYVAHGEEIVVHRLDGRVERVKAPEPGALGQDRTHVWWLATSGTLHARTERGWDAVALPDPPGAAAARGPVRIELVTTVASETLVGTARSEPASGKKRPVTVRTVYSSVSHGDPVHCGAPFRPGELRRNPSK